MSGSLPTRALRGAGLVLALAGLGLLVRVEARASAHPRPGATIACQIVTDRYDTTTLYDARLTTEAAFTGSYIFELRRKVDDQLVSQQSGSAETWGPGTISLGVVAIGGGDEMAGLLQVASASEVVVCQSRIE